MVAGTRPQPRSSRATHHEHTGYVTAVAVAPDGKTFATTSTDRTVNVWDAVTFKHLVRLRGHVGEVWSGAISPDGRMVMSGSAEGTTKLWSTDTARHDCVWSKNSCGFPVVEFQQATQAFTFEDLS